MGRFSRRLCALAVVAALPAMASAQGLYLHVVPLTVREGSPVDPAAPLRIAVYGVAPDAFIVSAGSTGVRSVADDHIEIELADYPQLEPLDPERFRAPSFVVDFDDPLVVTVRSQLLREYGEAPSIENLRRFTQKAITRKSMERGWDLASQVAASRVGDCTEHAVLLVALARSVERPARIALGLVIVTTGEKHYAFGHAWAEIHDGQRWLAVDATPLSEAGSLAYLPLTVLRDEGPGYAIPLARRMQTAWIRRLEILGNAPAR